MLAERRVTLPVEVVERVRDVLQHYADTWEEDCGDAAIFALTALDAALAAPDSAGPEPFSDVAEREAIDALYVTTRNSPSVPSDVVLAGIDALLARIQRISDHIMRTEAAALLACVGEGAE